MLEAFTIISPQTMTQRFDYGRAFSRNLGLVSPIEQKRLEAAKVAIPGCGGVGGLHALTLARQGIGRFSLADFDTFELENLNRQSGARMSRLGSNKVDTIRDDVLDINPGARIDSFREGVDETNVRDFLDGVDVVVDSLDFFAFRARLLVFTTARELGIPVVTAAPLGFSCALLVFTPEGMRFQDYFDLKPQDSPLIMAVKFAVGLAPRGLHFGYMHPDYIDLEAGKGPSSAIAIDLCAGMAACETLKLILRRGRVRPAPRYVQYDAFRGVLRQGRLWFGNRNPVQRLKTWYVRRFVLRGRGA